MMQGFVSITQQHNELLQKVGKWHAFGEGYGGRKP
jgi:hypothetical protein